MKRIACLILSAMLILLIASASVSAETASAELKIGMPSGTLPIGQTTTVPVVVSHVTDLIAFNLEVPNTLSGVTVLINQSQKPLDGSYTPNSKPENTVQRLSWFNAQPVTQDNLILCYLDITPASGAASPLSLTVTPISFTNNDGANIARTLSSIPAVIQLSSGGSSSGGGGSSGGSDDGPSLSLRSGWNFISVPKTLAPGSNTAAALFSGVDTDGHTPLAFDANKSKWDTISGSDPINTLTGYWIYAAAPVSIPLTYPKDPAPPAVKTLYPGWNAIGLSAGQPTAAANAFPGISWRILLPWNIATGDWDAAIVNGGSDANSPDRLMTTGNGYWLYVMKEDVLIGLTA